MSTFGNGLEAHRSVTTAIAAFAASPDDYPRVIARAISQGGDTDTLAAMAGAICGAHMGIEAIPLHLVEKLEITHKAVVTSPRSPLNCMIDTNQERRKTRVAGVEARRASPQPGAAPLLGLTPATRRDEVGKTTIYGCSESTAFSQSKNTVLAEHSTRI